MNETETIAIDLLDLDDISPRNIEDALGGGVYLIIGPSGSGKSRVIKSLLFSKRHFIPAVVAVSETEDLNNAYKPHVPQLFIYNKLEKGFVSKLQNRQTIGNQELKNSWLTVVFDDCMNKSTNFGQEDQIALFKTGRHYKMFVLMSCQHSLDLKPAQRDNCAGVFIMKQDNEKNRDKIYLNFASIVPNKKIFDALMDALTSDYSCMYIDTRNPSQNWKDKIRWYKASDLSTYGDWQATSLDVQEYNNDRFDKTYDNIHKKIVEIARNNI